MGGSPLSQGGSPLSRGGAGGGGTLTILRRRIWRCRSRRGAGRRSPPRGGGWPPRRACSPSASPAGHLRGGSGVQVTHVPPPSLQDGGTQGLLESHPGLGVRVWGCSPKPSVLSPMTRSHPRWGHGVGTPWWPRPCCQPRAVQSWVMGCWHRCHPPLGTLGTRGRGCPTPCQAGGAAPRPVPVPVPNHPSCCRCCPHGDLIGGLGTPGSECSTPQLAF